MTLKSEVAELCYEVAELSSGELRLTFTTDHGTFSSTVEIFFGQRWPSPL